MSQPFKPVTVTAAPRFKLGAAVIVKALPDSPGHEGQILGCVWEPPFAGLAGQWVYHVYRGPNWVQRNAESELVPVPVEPVPYDPTGLPPDGWPDTNDAPLTIDERRQIHNLLGHLQRAHKRAEQLVTRSVNLAADLDRLIQSHADPLRRVLWACPVPVDPPATLEEEAQP